MADRQASFMDVRSVLAQYGIRPSKGLGQNFLTDGAVLQRIIEVSEVGADDWVIEIGPGLGQLTQRLAQCARQVIAVELDRKMIAILQERLADVSNVTLIQGDILETDLARLLQSTGRDQAVAPHYKVVANLPYYITSSAIRHVLEGPLRPEKITFMVQHEVAQRIVAKPGQMSILSISVQVYGQPRIVSRVPASAFYPMPKVDSAVLTITPHAEPLVEEELMEPFFEAVHAGFGQKRKQLHNSLTHNTDLGHEEVIQALDRAGIEASRRPQTLSIIEWAELARQLRAIDTPREQ